MAKTRTPAQDLDTEQPPALQTPTSGMVSNSSAQDQLGNAAIASQTGVNGPGEERADISRYTPDYVEAHRDELGIPAGAPVEDFFNEFVAHKLAYQDLSSWKDVKEGDEDYASIQAQKKMLESWGYNSDIGEDQEVYDPETGLYAVRLDPSEQGLADGRGSVAAFRGTEPFTPHEMTLEHPLGLFNDIITDRGYSVGSTQYEANKDRIRALMAGGQGDLTATGHSLGGYLAQRAAADNQDLMDGGDVVTFQSGGLNSEDAEKMDSQNQDGHIGVRHHYTNMDVVHRAGEDRLDGQFFEHKANGLTQGHTKYLMYDDQDVTTISEATGGKTVVESDHDTVSEYSRHLWEGARASAGGLADIGMAPLGAAWGLGRGLGNGLVNAATGIGDSLGSAWEGVSGGFGTAWSGAASGADQMLHGDLLGGLGTIGQSQLSGAGQLLGGLGSGLWGLGETAVGAVGDTVGAVVDSGTGLISNTARGFAQLGRGGLNLVEGGVGATVEAGKWAGNKAVEAGEAAWEGAKWVGGKAADAGNAALDGAAWAGGKVLDAGAAVGEGVKSAWDFATSW